MIEFLRLILHIIASFFKPRTKLVAEILILRQQLNVLRRQVSKRPQLRNTDRFLFVWLYRWFPSVLSAIAILRPETIVRWHRAGFQSYWIIEAFPWDSSPRYLIRDRDTAYGVVFRQRLRAMGIRDKPTAPRSPWQNPYVERLIGSIRRECLDHLIVF